jgi:hypothetical protein
MQTRKLLQCSVVAAAMALSPFAIGSPITFTGSGTAAGNSVSAKATFSITGDVLTITLQNTSGTNSLEAPGNTLSGLFFDIGNLTLSVTPSSATAKTVFDSAACSPPSACAGGNVNADGEYGYAGPGAAGSSVPGGPGTTYAIASSGYLTTGLTMDIGNFNGGAAGTDLDGNASLDGIGFGIVSNNVGSLNGGLSGVPLVQDTMTFALTGVSNDLVGLDPSTLINTVSFQYGTAITESNVRGVPQGGTAPEPKSILLVGLALVLLVGHRKMRAA